jgi:hypothetical protein
MNENFKNYGREELQADLVLLAVVVALVNLTYSTF